MKRKLFQLYIRPEEAEVWHLFKVLCTIKSKTYHEGILDLISEWVDINSHLLPRE